MARSSPELLNEAARALAAPLPPLLVAAQRIASTVAPGVHGRRRVGPGEAFWQFRHFVHGDATARIDWRRSARSEHLFVRENEWEAAQTVWLWRDGSASMRYRSALGGEDKIDRASLLVLALGVLLVRGGERVGLLDGDAVARSGEAALRRMGLALQQSPPASAGWPDERPLPRYARLVLASDFLDPIDDWRARLRLYSGMGVRGHLVHVLDPAEEDLPFAGRVRFSGLEADGEVMVGRVEALADAYRARIAERRQRLIELAHAAGWTYTAHRTDRPPHTALLVLHAAVSSSFQAGSAGGAA